MDLKVKQIIFLWHAIAKTKQHLFIGLGSADPTKIKETDNVLQNKCYSVFFL
jgi:hypothetical protein